MPSNKNKLHSIPLLLNIFTMRFFNIRFKVYSEIQNMFILMTIKPWNPFKKKNL